MTYMTLVLLRKQDQVDERIIREWCNKSLSGKYHIIKHYKKGIGCPLAWTIEFSNDSDRIMAMMYWS